MGDVKKALDNSFAVAGRVRRAFGVRGQLSVDWNNGACPVEIGSENIYLRATGEDLLTGFVIVADHRHGNYSVITIDGISSRVEAERYKGSDVWVNIDDLPALAGDEYYTYELLGMRVRTTKGEALGVISKIFSTGSNDVYVVRKGDKELLIPAIKDVVKEVDVAGKVMVVELIDGLES